MRSKKAAINIITSMSDQVVATICAFLIPRLILTTFGSEYFGVVQSITQYMGIVDLMTIGLGGAARVALFKPLSDNNYYEISRIIKAFRIHVRRAAVMLTAYIVILAFLYPYISHNNLSNTEITAFVVIIGMRTMAETLMMGVSLSLLAADQIFSVYSCSMLVARIANAAIIFALISQGKNIVTVYFFSNLAFIAAALIMEAFINKHYRLTRNCEPNNEAFALRGAVAYHNIARYIHENVDITLLTIFAEASLISVYSIYHLVTAKMHVIMGVFTNGLEGAFGNMWAKREFDSFKRNFHLYELCVYCFVSVVFSCVGVLILPFVSLYTANVNDQNYIFMNIAVFSTIAEGIYCLREPYLTIAYATGNYEKTKRASAYEAVLNLTISLALIHSWGIVGLLIGTIAANTFRTIHFIWFDYKNILKESYKGLVWRFVFLTMNLIISSGIGVMIVSRHSVSGWGDWIVIAMLVFAESVLVTVINAVIVNRTELMLVLLKLRHIVKLKK